MFWRAMGMLMLVIGLLSPGCGSRSDLPLVPVSGTVTFAGGPCPSPGSIAFMPGSGSSGNGLPNRPGSARFDTDGKFVVTSFHEGDGLLPGTYGVNISCHDSKYVPGTPNAASLDHMPPGFRPDDLVVKQGQAAIEVNYDVPAKK
jgi:hypothetical protein